MSKKESKPTIESKIEKLREDVEWFYSDGFDLGQATQKYKKATELAKEIERDLGEMMNEIEIISKDFSEA